MSKKSYEQFTDQARQAMARAHEEARAFHHEYIGTEHVLLALVAEDSGIGADVLQALGVDTHQVRVEIEKLVHSGPESVAVDERPLTPRAREALEFARQEALCASQGHVDTEHLLLGLLREPDGVAGVVLRNLGLNLDAVREEVLKIRVLQMKIVERAVRLVRATSVRKLKMREELLAHLTDIYEQEHTRLSDPVQATEAAACRFGDPVELAHELQTIVPWYDRYEATLDRWFGRRAQESTVRFVTRVTVLVFCQLISMPVLAAPFVVRDLGWNANAWIALRPIVAVLVCLPAAYFFLGLLYFAIRNTLFGVFGQRKSWRRLFVLQTLFGVVVIALGCGFAALAAWDLRQAREILIPSAATGIVAAIGAWVVARSSGPNEIRDAMWARLDVEA